MADPDQPRRRRTFGPVLLLGLAAGTLGAVAGNKPWAHGSDGAFGERPALALTADAEQMPLAGALALVVLACWGVILVSRGTVRRAVAALGALASAGMLASVVVGWSSVPDSLRSSFADVGITDQFDVTRTGWYWAAGVAALASIVATVLAIRCVPDWPEMGSRYDAPGADRAPAPADLEDQTSLDLWKAMDEGRDPTE